MSYPSFEQYQEALQSPQITLLDSELKNGAVRSSGLGLPLALCGGFALTYDIKAGSKRYAVRCFHKEASGLERRYQAIANRLRGLASPYFLPFEFIREGIRVAGKPHPIVKMAWASGDTLSTFLEREHGRASSLQALRGSLRGLAEHLEKASLAHGDIQPGNIIVADGGRTLQLIDYDGMFVPELRGTKATEVGHPNFQHPCRSNADFNEHLDRFSFIALDVALQALLADPKLWQRTQSDPDGVVFRSNDYSSPTSSAVFSEVSRLSGLKQSTQDLASIVSAPFASIPSLLDFLTRRNIPQIVVAFGSIKADAASSAYRGAYPVLSAVDFDACARHVGDRVELVGRIFEIKTGQTRHGSKFVFVNFSSWRGRAVKLSIWREGLKLLTAVPDASWAGKWVSVTGLMEPPYANAQRGYVHLSVTINEANQIRVLPQAEANFRLANAGRSSRSRSNADVVSSMGGRANSPAPAAKSAIPSLPPKSPNQQILERMQKPAPTAPLSSTVNAGAASQRAAAAKPTPAKPAGRGFLVDAVSWLRKHIF